MKDQMKFTNTKTWTPQDHTLILTHDWLRGRYKLEMDGFIIDNHKCFLGIDNGRSIQVYRTNGSTLGTVKVGSTWYGKFTYKFIENLGSPIIYNYESIR